MINKGKMKYTIMAALVHVNALEANKRLGLNKITATFCALEIATFNLFLLKKQSLCLGRFSASEDVIEIKTTFAC